MVTGRIREIIRRFKENGMKLLLENPGNAQDFLAILETDVVQWIDFPRMQVLRTTFVKRDWRHVEADVVLRAPLISPKGKGTRRKLLVHILIEHQSEPDRFMLLRVLEYVVEIFKSQMRQWSRRHASFADLRLQPVLPVVFYTGTRKWKGLGRLVDLIERGDLFTSVTPALQPLFVNLETVAGDILEKKGGFFGQILRLLRHRGDQTARFKEIFIR